MEMDKDETKRRLGRNPGLRSAVRTVRWISQIGFLALFLFLVTGTVCAVVIARGITVSETLGLLQVVLASIRNPFVISTALVVGSMIFIAVVILVGRAFCAWACPLGTAIDVVDTALQKLKFRPLFTRHQGSKQHATSTNLVRNGMNRYAVLGAALTASALFRSPVWCAVCPIGTLCRGVAAGAELAIGTEILAIPVAAGALSIGEKRFWCRYLCPVGGLLTLLSRLNPFIKPRIRRDASHRDCGACKTICPEGIDICNEKSFARCTKCLDCYAKCPFGSVKVAFK